MVSNKFNFKPIIDQLKSFTTFDFIYNASNLLEKLFWAVIAIGGTLWIGYIVMLTLNHWNEHIFLVTKSTQELSELTAPAITLCSKGMSEYSLLERFANYIDPNNIPEEVLIIRREAMKEYFAKVDYDSDCEKVTTSSWGGSFKFLNFITYQNTCCGADERCKVKFNCN